MSGLPPNNRHSDERWVSSVWAKGGSRRSHSIAVPDVSDELSATTASARLVNKFDHFEAHNRPSTITRLAELLCRASGRRSGAWKHIHDYHGQSASISWVSCMVDLR
jgi:hypothetical protein